MLHEVYCILFCSIIFYQLVIYVFCHFHRNVYINLVHSVAKPWFIEPTSLENEVLDSGDPFKYSCKVDGNPTPWVQWIMKSENRKVTNVSKKESILEIEKMDQSYVGNYTCRAWNSLGVIERHFLELELNPPG